MKIEHKDFVEARMRAKALYAVLDPVSKLQKKAEVTPHDEGYNSGLHTINQHLATEYNKQVVVANALSKEIKDFTDLVTQEERKVIVLKTLKTIAVNFATNARIIEEPDDHPDFIEGQKDILDEVLASVMEIIDRMEGN